MDQGVEDRRVAIEAIATLVHIKNTMADLLLKPSGVPLEVYRPLLNRRDESTGRPLSKRQVAPLILEALDQRGMGQAVVRALVERTANWDSFHLADDEYAARATVQKARAVLGTIEQNEARERERREAARQEQLARQARERADVLRRESDLLLMMLDELAGQADPHQRGFLLEDLLNRVFRLHDIPVEQGFRRNRGGEQIDGGFRLDGWYYLVECRWREKPSDVQDLDGLVGKAGRSGKQTMGLFVSINGWSRHVVDLLKQNPDKCVILMDGFDLRTALTGQADLRDLLLAKAAALNLRSEPFLGAAQYLSEQTASV